MKIVKDNQNRDWTLKVDVNALRRIQDLLGVNFADLRNLSELLRRLRTDDLFVVDVTWAICHPQCAGHKIDRDQFGDGFGGDATGRAHKAILEEFGPDFFRDPETRAVASLVFGETDQWWKRVSTSGSKSTALPESSESTPAPSLSANS